MARGGGCHHNTTFIADFPLGRAIGVVVLFSRQVQRALVGHHRGRTCHGRIGFAAFTQYDPVQSRLGILPRRLFAPDQHAWWNWSGLAANPSSRASISMRLLDLWDTGASLLRILRLINLGLSNATKIDPISDTTSKMTLGGTGSIFRSMSRQAIADPSGTRPDCICGAIDIAFTIEFVGV
jgi:hypothetical protein